MSEYSESDSIWPGRFTLSSKYKKFSIIGIKKFIESMATFGFSLTTIESDFKAADTTYETLDPVGGEEESPSNSWKSLKQISKYPKLFEERGL